MHEHRYNQIAARGRRRRRRDHTIMVLRLTAAALALVLLGELAGALLWSPRFRLRRVELSGLRMLDSRQVILRADLKPGITLGRLSTGAIRDRLQAIPAVESASAARRWPEGLAIVVHERIPAAFIRRGKGIIFLDRGAVGFTAPRADTAGLPELKGFRVNLARLGRPQRSRALRVAMTVLAAAQENAMPVSQVVAAAPNQLELRLSDGTALRLGRPEQLRLKLSQAKVALLQLQPLHRVEYIDVSCPDAAVWKPRAEL
jgi:cell division protein FtsQ